MTTYLEYWTKSLALGLSFLITLPHAHAQTMPTELNIVVLEGEGATNNVRQRVARDPVVRVEDENHKPIVGAAVVFTLPTGPGDCPNPQDEPRRRQSADSRECLVSRPDGPNLHYSVLRSSSRRQTQFQ